MDLSEVQKRVQQIREIARDAEAAHSMEDELFADLLWAIADGNVQTIEKAQQMAVEALKTQDIDFPRWCA